jgi:hypothetical protein
MYCPPIDPESGSHNNSPERRTVDALLTYGTTSKASPV